MLVIHEEILFKVIIIHFLLFCVNIFWLIFFAFYIGSQWRGGWKTPEINVGGWFQRTAPVVQSPYADTTSRQRRGWFDRR